MSNIKQVYVDTTDSEQTIKGELYYTKGSDGMWSSKPQARRYWMAVKIVKLIPMPTGYTSEQFAIFGNGFKKQLVECQRSSKASEAKAIALFKMELPDVVLEFATKQALTIKKTEAGAVPAFANLGAV